MTGTARTWRSWHLHVASLDPQALETVVVTALPPVLELVGPTSDGQPRPWFFIRYWQAGPHVRLRIADLGDRQAADVEALLADRLARIDADLPEERRLTPDAYRRSVEPLAAIGEYGSPLPVEQLAPPGAHRAEYQPEYERYGGPALLPYSEDLFHASSVVCLRACRARPDHRHAFLDGLELLAASLSAWPDRTDRTDRPDRSGLLAGHRDGWRALLARRPGGPPDWEGLDRAVRADAERLAPTAPALRELVAGAPCRWSTWTKRLRAAAGGWSTTLGPERARQILGSHVHMAHNRLGLSPLREAQLAAVLLALDVTGAPAEPEPATRRGAP
ncbi:thiopeptide-type bacteriocin biosynthesis protein [Peterkaempfera bronchialis]|nr:thiopeptide-type bacteriocin biosynthesis protein [Peterkaempfera bronchialis]